MPRSRRLRPSIVLAAAVIAAEVGACGSSTHSAANAARSTTTIASTEIARAAAVSGASKGFSYRLAFSEQVPSSGSITVGGTGDFSIPARSGETTLRITGAPMGLGTLALTEITTPKALYLKPPAVLASHLPQGKSWLSLDAADISKLSGIPGISTFASGADQMSDPTQFLKLLEGDASSVAKVGNATVDGVPTTEYRLVVDLGEVAQNLPAQQRAALTKVLAKAGREFGITSLPMNVYIDSANLVRRITTSFTVTPPNSTLRVATAVRVDFLSYGAQPTPATPPAAQTVDLEQFIQSVMGSGGGFFG